VTIKEITPSGTVSNNATKVGGAVSVAATVSDNSWKTYLRSWHAGIATLTRFSMNTYTLAPNQRCKAVRVAQAMAHPYIPIAAWSYINNVTGQGLGVWRTLPWPDVKKPVFAYVSPWFFKDAGDSSEWVQSKIDGMEVYFYWRNPGGTPPAWDTRLYELLVQLWIVEQPVATNVAPAIFGKTDTRFPTFVWNLFQEDNSAADRVQQAWQLKVWDDASVIPGSFDPDVTTPVFTINSIGGPRGNAALNKWKLPTNSTVLNYGSKYQWSVKVANRFNGQLWWSEWSDLTVFTVEARPTLNITAPVNASVLTGVSRPTVTWTYSDSEGKAQSRYEIRVYKRPGASWTGFNPDTTTVKPFWSKVGLGDLLTDRVMNILTDDEVWRVYVRVAHPIVDSPGYLWSDWDFNDFTTNYTAPNPPLLTLGADGADRAAIYMYPGAVVSGAPVDHYDVQRSLDGGETWEYFRNDGPEDTEDIPSTGGVILITDHEIGYDKEVLYRGFAVRIDVGVDVHSVPSNILVAKGTAQKVWIKSPIHPELNYAFTTTDSWLQGVKQKSRAVKQAMGRTRPIVVRGTAASYAFSVGLVLRGNADRGALDALVDLEETLYVQTPKGSWYADVSGSVSEAASIWDDRQGEERLWKVTVPFQEVDFS
jgi:hypothetical protein